MELLIGIDSFLNFAHDDDFTFLNYNKFPVNLFSLKKISKVNFSNIYLCILRRLQVGTRSPVSSLVIRRIKAFLELICNGKREYLIANFTYITTPPAFLLLSIFGCKYNNNNFSVINCCY